MIVIDISWPIATDMTSCKNDEILKAPKKNGIGYNQCQGSCSSYTGTHVDVPGHVFVDGNTNEHVGLTELMGYCDVLDLTNVEDTITADDLKKHELSAGAVVLLKTRNSYLDATAPCSTPCISLAASGAEYLVEKQVKAVGIDCISIEQGQQHTTHTALFECSVPVIKGLRLAAAAARNYFFICLPLLTIGLQAVPARAALLVI